MNLPTSEFEHYTTTNVPGKSNDIPTAHVKYPTKHKARANKERKAGPHLLTRLCPSRCYPLVEQQIGTPIVPLLSAEDILRANIRNELIVDAYPRLSRSVAQVAIGMEDVESVVPA